MITYVVGDATKPLFENNPGSRVIAHICNDEGGWGRGFVLYLSKKWKQPEQEYRYWHKKKTWKGRPFVLGQIQTVWVEDNIFVVNMIAQRDYRPLTHMDVPLGLPNVNYASLRECLTRLNIDLKQTNCSLHMPRIGSGLGGGDWNYIERLIESIITVPTYIYDLNEIPGTRYEIL